jgi:hypothetical protein
MPSTSAKPSNWLLGLTLDDERALEGALGGKPGGFFALAQRVAWGLTQSDLIRADPRENAAALVRRYGQAFPAHLFEAWAWRERDADRAERALERARGLASPDHSLFALLPSDAEWTCAVPAQRLVEVSPGTLWRVAHAMPLTGSPFHVTSVTTVVRTKEGDLAIINPVALGDDVATDIEKLGRVRWVLSQGKVHSKYLAVVRNRFPGSIALGTQGHLKHAPAAHLELDGLLETFAEMPRDLEPMLVRGHLFEEVLLVHRPTSTLIVQDMVANGRRASAGFAGRLYGFAFGLFDRIGFMSYNLPFWQDVPALHESFRAVRASGFTQVTGAHWPLELAGGEDCDAVQRAIDYALETSSLAHKGKLGRYFWTQPGFFRDLVRYKVASRGVSAGATLRGVTSGSAQERS